MTATEDAPTAEAPATFDDLARRVDELRDRVRHTDEHARALLDETIEAVTDFNRAGLVTLVQVLREDPRGEELLFAAVDRPEVMALLVSHGIVRVDRTLDVLRVVDQLRPYLAAESIELDVDRVEGDVAFVRFGTGCSAPAAETKAEIRAAILQRVPGLTAVEEVAATGGAFVPVTSLRVGPPA
jgi:Fe-S cluster biogenesis protein NfuA